MLDDQAVKEQSRSANIADLFVRKIALTEDGEAVA